jgi:hypothetical protein
MILAVFSEFTRFTEFLPLHGLLLPYPVLPVSLPCTRAEKGVY